MRISCVVVVIFVFAVGLWKVVPVHAATGINDTINFQGKLVDDDGLNVADATYSVVFSLYDVDSGGTAIWTETQNVDTTDGLFQVHLGSSTDLPGSVDFNTDNIYLGIKVGADAEMTPRIRFAAVPYAFNAQKVAGLTVTDTTGTLTIPNGKTIQFGDAFTTTGANALTLATTGTTSITLPTTGTLLTNTAAANQTITSTQTSGTLLSLADSTGLSGNITGMSVTLSGSGAHDQTGLSFNLSGASGSNLNDIVGTGGSWKVSRDGALTVASCTGCGGGPGGPGGDYLRLSSGAFSFINDTADYLFGSNASSSAKFKLSPSGTSPTASVSGRTAQAAFIVDNQGVGDLFTASSSGLNRFVIKQNGNVGVGVASPTNWASAQGFTNNLTVAGGIQTGIEGQRGSVVLMPGSGGSDSGYIAFYDAFGNGLGSIGTETSGLLTIDGNGENLYVSNGGLRVANLNAASCDVKADTNGVLSCGTDAGGSGSTQYLRLSSGAFSLVNDTTDYLFGSNASSSAKFKLSPSGASPTASISGRTGQAALLVDNQGTGDLFSASASGMNRFVIKSNGNVGIGTSNPTAVLHVVGATPTGTTGVSATEAMRVIAGSGSSSSTAEGGNGGGFTLTSGNGGNGGFNVIGFNGGSAGNFAFAGGNGGDGAASFDAGGSGGAGGGFSFTGGNGGLGSQLGGVGGNGGSITLQGGVGGVGGDGGTSNGSHGNVIMQASGGSVGIGTSTPMATLDIRGTLGTTPFASISGQSSRAGLVVDNNGVGDLFTASKSGATKFVILNSGNLRLNNYQSCTALETDSAGNLLCGSDDGGAGGANYLRLSNGAFSLVNDTTDFLFGSSASNSAKFKLSPSGTSPTASVSGNTAQAALVVDNSGVGDLFTASASGLNRFVIKSNGKVGIGTTQPNATVDIAASVGETGGISGSTYKNLQINFVRANGGSGNAYQDYGSYVSLADSTILTSTNDIDGLMYGNYATVSHTGNVSGGFNKKTYGGYFSSAATGSIGVASSAEAYGIYAQATGTTTGTGTSNAIGLYATASGGDNNFAAIFGNGNVRFDSLTSCSSLATNGTGVLGCGAGSGTSYTRLENGAFSYINDTADFLFGSNATSSAKFKLSASGTGPVASVSGSTSRAALTVDNTGVGDLFTASKSGKTHFTVTNSGNVRIANLVNCDTIDTNANGELTCGSDAGAGGAPQVKSTSGTGSSALSTSEVSLTSLEVTPSSSGNEILVLAKYTARSSTTQDRTNTLRVRRGANCTATQVGADASSFSTNSSGDDYMDIFASRIDAPATTSSTTYQLCALSSGTSVTATYWDLTLMEVAQGADYAELYDTNDETLEAGDVVALDSSLQQGVKKSTKAYEKEVIGIVSSRPGKVIGSTGSKEGVNALPIALSGRVPVKVSTENGKIKAGDLLTSSSIPGVAMKANKSGQIIGQAMAAFEGNDIGRVMVFVKTDYATGSSLQNYLEGLEIAGPQASADASKLALVHFMSQKEQLEQSRNLSELLTDRVTAGLELVTPQVLTDKLSVNTIKAATGNDVAVDLSDDGQFVLKNASGEAIVKFDAQGNAVFSGTVKAGKFEIAADSGLASLETKTAQQDARITSLENKIATSSSTSTVVSVASSNSAETTKVVTAESLSVAGAATVSANLRVQGNSLIEGILTVVDTLTVSNFIVNKLANFFGEVVFHSDVFYRGTAYFNTDTAGYITVAKGSDKAEVKFGKPYKSEPVVNATVVTTKLSDDAFKKMIEEGICDKESAKAICEEKTTQDAIAKAMPYVIASRSTDGFTILLSQPATQDLTFSWSALAVIQAEEIVLKGGDTHDSN